MLRLVELALFLSPFVAFIAWRFMALERGSAVDASWSAAACVMIVLAAAWSG